MSNDTPATCSPSSVESRMTDGLPDWLEEIVGRGKRLTDDLVAERLAASERQHASLMSLLDRDDDWQAVQQWSTVHIERGMADVRVTPPQCMTVRGVLYLNEVVVWTWLPWVPNDKGSVWNCGSRHYAGSLAEALYLARRAWLQQEVGA